MTSEEVAEAEDVVGMSMLLTLGVTLGELGVGVLVGGAAPEPEDNDADADADEDADEDVDVMVEDGMKMPPGVECDTEFDVECDELEVRSLDFVAEEVSLGVGVAVLFRREEVIGITTSDGDGAGSEADEEEVDLVDVARVLPPSREEGIGETTNVDGVADEGETKSTVDDGEGNNNDESIGGTDCNDNDDENDDDEEDTYTAEADVVGSWPGPDDGATPGPAGALADPDAGAPPLPLPPLPPTMGLDDMGWPVTQSSGRAALDEMLTKSGPGSG